MLADVRYGSFASILAYPGHVRYSPHRDRIADKPDVRKADIAAHLNRDALATSPPSKRARHSLFLAEAELGHISLAQQLKALRKPSAFASSSEQNQRSGAFVRP